MPYFDANDTPKPGDSLYEVHFMRRNGSWDWEDYYAQAYAKDHREAIEKAKKLVNTAGTRGWKVVKKKKI